MWSLSADESSLAKTKLRGPIGVYMLVATPIEDLILLDSAGRQVVDQEFMSELINIEDNFKPQETLLVADALTGQDAANIAKSFGEAIKITGEVITEGADPVLLFKKINETKPKKQSI